MKKQPLISANYTPLYINIAALVALCCVSGLVSLWLGQDVGVDVLTYHIYNPFSFLGGRFFMDIMPANIHTFLNPLPDVPYYLLIKYLNNYPRLVTFLAGFSGGFLIFIVYKIAKLLLNKTGLAVLATCIGVSGTMTVSQLGMTSNEVMQAVLLCSSFYLLLLCSLRKEKLSYLFWSAFITGAAVGLKYTAAPFVFGLLGALFVNLFFLKEKRKSFVWFVLGGIAGFLLTNGFFMWRLYHAYGNPVFPFMNAVFQSPYFDPVNFDETRFYPRSVAQWLFYPFYWITKSDGLVTEPHIWVADARMALGYIAVVILSVRLAISRWGKKWVLSPLQMRVVITLLAFIIPSYIVWIRHFAILRYIVTLEVLGSILVVLVIDYCISSCWQKYLGVCLLLLGLACFTTYPTWNRRPCGKKVIEINLPKVPPNSLIVYYQEGLGFLSPFFPSDAQFIGGIKLPVESYPQDLQIYARQRNPLPPEYWGYHFRDEVKQKIASHKGMIFIVAAPWAKMLAPETLEPYGLQYKNHPCILFDANINLYFDSFVICRVMQLQK